MKFLMVLFFATQTWATQFQKCADFQPKGTFKNEDAKLDSLMKLHWNYLMQAFPEWATFVGVPGHNDKWTDDSIVGIAARKADLKCELEALKRIKSKSLSIGAKLNFDLLMNRYSDLLDGQKFPGEYLAISHMDGVHATVADVLMASPQNNLQDIKNLLTRLSRAATKIQQNKLILQEGLKLGITAPQAILHKVPSQFDSLLPIDPKNSALFEPFKVLPQFLSEAEKQDIQKQALTIIAKQIYPEFEALKNFLITEYIPKARKSVSWADLPNGADWYNYNVKYHTTTTMTAEEIHQLGLTEVDRIEKEMNKIKDEVKFKGSLAEFNRYLSSDRKFQFDQAKDLLAGYREIAKRADAELPKLFGRLPRLPYGVREIPEFKAKGSAAGYYYSGSLEAGRAGYFEANTSDLPSRPKWVMEALVLHEAVPGHHLQIALAQEQGELPEFRKNDGYTAFSEGWGLYAESLGDMMQMYQDPYSKYGKYSYELWRAVRLVVDTGVHKKGWSREQALKYFQEHLPKSALETEVEVDRYLVWPGQALAYKVGQLKFLELRKKAEDELKDGFSIRKFHDQVLGYGAVPLNILDQQMDLWLEKEKSKQLSAKKN